MGNATHYKDVVSCFLPILLFKASRPALWLTDLTYTRVLFCLSLEVKRPRMRLFSDLQLAQRSQISGDKSPFPHMTSWPAQGKFLYLLLLLLLLFFFSGGLLVSGQNLSFALCATAKICMQ